MGLFKAHPFNPETDPDRPKIGDTVDYNGKLYEIMEVDHASLTQIVLEDTEPLKGYDICLSRAHATRIMFWRIWANKIKPITPDELEFLKGIGKK